jgi:hypothetical protein
MAGMQVNFTRRALLARVAVGVAVTVAAAPEALAEESVVSEDEAAARAVQYVSDAARAANAKPGQTCANCSLSDSKPGAQLGHCTLFAGRLVQSAGWCAAWTNM